MSSRTSFRPLLPFAAALLLAAAPGPARGDDDCDVRNRFHFSVSRHRDVQNDWVTAVLAVSHEDPDAAQVADRINKDMAWALERARDADGLEVRTGGYSTGPVRDRQGRLTRWRGSQQLLLEGPDVKALAALVGTLQERLQMQSMDFGVSPERHRKVEGELVDEALEAFRARAERVRRNLGAKSVEWVRVDLGGGGGAPPPRVRSMAMAMEADVAPPALEAGTSRVEMSASGSIELGY